MSSMTTTLVGNLRRFVATAILGSLSLGFSGASLADGSSDVRQLTVKYGDLNITNPDGARALYKRISTAAWKVCAPPDGSMRYISETEKCVHKSIADAVTAVNQPALYAAYNEKNKTPLATNLLAQGR
jgi:UrcA family protein